MEVEYADNAGEKKLPVSTPCYIILCCFNRLSFLNTDEYSYSLLVRFTELGTPPFPSFLPLKVSHFGGAKAAQIGFFASRGGLCLAIMEV